MVRPLDPEPAKPAEEAHRTALAGGAGRSGAADGHAAVAMGRPREGKGGQALERARLGPAST